MKPTKPIKTLEQQYDAALARAERDNVQVIAARFAQEAKRATRESRKAAEAAASLAPLPARAKSAEAKRAQGAAQRVVAYAEQAVQSAIRAAASVKAARRFVPQRGDLTDLCKTRQQAVFAWLSSPDTPDHAVQLSVLRVRVEEAEAAAQAALPVPALVS